MPSNKEVHTMITRTALGLVLVIATASGALAAHKSANQSAYDPAPIVRQVHPVDGCSLRVAFPACSEGALD